MSINTLEYVLKQWHDFTVLTWEEQEILKKMAKTKVKKNEIIPIICKVEPKKSKRGGGRPATKIICLNDGKIYANLKDTAEAYNTSKQAICKAIARGTALRSGLKFKRLEEK